MSKGLLRLGQSNDGGAGMQFANATIVDRRIPATVVAYRSIMLGHTGVEDAGPNEKHRPHEHRPVILRDGLRSRGMHRALWP
jgi:hypothetical protein